MRREFERDSVKGSYNLDACIVVSKNSGDALERIRRYVEKGNKENAGLKYYIISKKQAERLSQIGIDLRIGGCHHFVPKNLSKEAKRIINQEKDKTKIRLLNNLRKDMDFDLVISMPNALHQNNNKVFAGDFTPEEVLKKLNWILGEGQEFGKGHKESIIDLFSIVCIFGGKDKDSLLDLKKVVELKESYKPIVPRHLLSFFRIEKKGIVKYLENFFFYPEYCKYSKHFQVLSELRTGDRIRKSNVEFFQKN